MKYLIPFLLLIGCFILVCSDSSTDSDDPINQGDTVLTVFYQTDDSKAVTSYVSASSGGTITTTDSEGIIYTLTVPAHSLAISATLTITPVDTLAVEGPVVIVGIGDSSFCIPGIICEPEGLMFDSGATLTIQFPETINILCDSTFTAVYFDTVMPAFYPIAGSFDTLTNTFTCEIFHFSGYTTVNVPPTASDCDLLMATYSPAYEYAYSAAGSDIFYYTALKLYEIKASNTRTDPYGSGQSWLACSWFNSLVDNDMITLINRHWEVLEEYYNNIEILNLNISSVIRHYERLDVIYGYTIGTAAQSACEQVKTAMRIFISDKLRTIAGVGYQMCQEDNCAGRDIMLGVLTYGEEGWIITPGLVTDDAYNQQILAWINDCCSEGLDVHLVIPESNRIKRLAIAPDEVAANLYYYVCSVEVHVTNPSGTPVAGCSVRLFREGEDSRIANNSTNDDGVATFIINPNSLEWNCIDKVEWMLYADAYETGNGQWYESDNRLPVTFVNQMITTTINYTYNYDWDSGDEPMLNETATLIGSGTSPLSSGTGSCLNTCEGVMLRDYFGTNIFWDGVEQEYVDNTWETTGNDTISPCRAVPELHSTVIGGQSIMFIYGATVGLGDAVFTGLIYENSTGSTDTLHYGLGMSVWPEDPFYFYASAGGIIGDTTWTYNEIVNEGTSTEATVTATLQVTITTEEAE